MIANCRRLAGHEPLSEQHNIAQDQWIGFISADIMKRVRDIQTLSLNYAFERRIIIMEKTDGASNFSKLQLSIQTGTNEKSRQIGGRMATMQRWTDLQLMWAPRGKKSEES